MIAASESVRNVHLDSIHALFNTTGHGENLWNSLTLTERELFCVYAGCQRSAAKSPLSKMRVDVRKNILKSIKAIGRASALFHNVSLNEFGGGL